MWSISIYLQRVSSPLKAAAENTTASPNCSQETYFWRKGDGYSRPCKWHAGYFCFTCKSHPRFSSSLCRKSDSTVMKHMPFYATPISWRLLNDCVLNTSPAGDQRSHTSSRSCLEVCFAALGLKEGRAWMSCSVSFWSFQRNQLCGQIQNVYDFRFVTPAPKNSWKVLWDLCTVSFNFFRQPEPCSLAFPC